MNYLKNLMTVMLTAIALTLGMAGVANAVEVPAEERAYVINVRTIGDETTYGLFTLTLDKTVPEGSTATTTVTDCHDGNVTSNSHPVKDMSAVGVGSIKTGAILNWSTVITQPGFDPYTLSGVYNPRNVTCGNDVVKNPCDDLAVQKWSTKRSGFSKAKAGRTIRVTKTLAADCRVLYHWNIGGYNVKTTRGTSFKVRQNKLYRGMPMKVTIVVSSEYNDDVATKTLRFGRVKK